jgi:hypothetical protein
MDIFTHSEKKSKQSVKELNPRDHTHGLKPIQKTAVKKPNTI